MWEATIYSYLELLSQYFKNEEGILWSQIIQPDKKNVFKSSCAAEKCTCFQGQFSTNATSSYVSDWLVLIAPKNKIYERFYNNVKQQQMDFGEDVMC